MKVYNGERVDINLSSVTYKIFGLDPQVV